MALAVQPLFEAAADAFSTSDARERFTRNFLASLNFVLDELAIAGDISISHVTSADTSISELDAKHGAFVMAGLRVYLMDFRQQPKDSGLTYDRMLGRWEQAKGDFMVSLSSEDQDTEDSDGNPSADIVGWGYIDP